jgi:hypothetical protein
MYAPVVFTAGFLWKRKKFQAAHKNFNHSHIYSIILALQVVLLAEMKEGYG